MKEVPREFKENTIAIDFDGVIHLYSKGFQGMDNAYDPPTPGTREALQELKDAGYRLIIVSSRDIETIGCWLIEHHLDHFFDVISNTKHPAKYYIDDHAIRFSKGHPKAWPHVLKFIQEHERIA